MSPDVGFVTVLVLGLILSLMSAAFVAMTVTLPDIPSKSDLLTSRLPLLHVLLQIAVLFDLRVVLADSC